MAHSGGLAGGALVRRNGKARVLHREAILPALDQIGPGRFEASFDAMVRPHSRSPLRPSWCFVGVSRSNEVVSRLPLFALPGHGPKPPAYLPAGSQCTVTHLLVHSPGRKQTESQIGPPRDPGGRPANACLDRWVLNGVRGLRLSNA